MHLVDDAWDSVLESQLLRKTMISQTKNNDRFFITRQMLVLEHGGASIVIGGISPTGNSFHFVSIVNELQCKCQCECLDEVLMLRRVHRVSELSQVDSLKPGSHLVDN
jgi:hypothetical protein